MCGLLRRCVLKSIVPAPVAHRVSHWVGENGLDESDHPHKETPMTVIAERMQEVRPGEPQAHCNLTLVPLLAPGPETPGYRLLDEALAAGCARVTEVSESGSVPELRFVNSGSARNGLFISAIDVIVGLLVVPLAGAVAPVAGELLHGDAPAVG